MNRYWLKIGLGAAGIFAAGMFVITLGRNVRNAAAEALRSGGTVNVPLAILPFEIDGRKVGTVRQVQVERGQDRVKRVNVTVSVKDGHRQVAEFDGCVFTVGGHGRHSGLFDCETVAAAEARGMVQIGEIRFEPSGVVRPIMIEAVDAADWFDGSQGSVNIQAGQHGTNMLIDGADGAQVKLEAGADGAYLRVRDKSGKEVVRIDAGGSGVQVKVDADKP